MRLTTFITEEKVDKQRWKSYLAKVPMLKTSIKVLTAINKKGYEAYIVGGGVRDIVIGTNLHDVDIATNMPMEELEKMYKTYDIGQSKDFGIVVIKVDGFDYEVAQFRQDGKYIDGRKPETVQIVQTFQGDASRRDFTFNAMAIDKDGNIIDYFDGRKDIKNNVIKTVGNPIDRFEEDALRMLRAVRFSSKLGFEIEPETKGAIKQLKKNVTKLSPERIRDELMKMASQSGTKFADAITMLDDVGILEIILPEIVKLKEFRDDPKWHPEEDEQGVFSHVLSALRRNKSEDPIVNLAILFHDLGKGVTAGTKDNGWNNFHGHASAAKDIVLDIAARLRLTNKQRDAIMFAALNHMKFHELMKMKPRKILDLVYDEHWETLKAVAFCDDSCRLQMFDRKKWDDRLKNIEDIEKKWGSKVAGGAVKIVDGKRVIELTGLRPSKMVGEIIKKVTDEVLAKGIKNPKEIDKLIKQTYKDML